MDYLKQQLKAILNTDVKVIKLLDRSFNAKTEHALEILDFVFKNCHPGVQLQFEINGDVLDQRIIVLLMKKHLMVYLDLKSVFNQLMNQQIKLFKDIKTLNVYVMLFDNSNKIIK